MSRVTTTLKELNQPERDGRSRRWQAHRAKRRRELSRAARKAVHHRGTELSMDEFASAMGTSKSIVYRYFTDKAGLQAAVADLVLEEMAEAFETAAHSGGDPRQRLQQMIATYMTMVDSSPNVYRFIVRDGGGTDLSEFLSAITAYVRIPVAEALAGTKNASLAAAALAGVDGAAGMAQTLAAGAVGFVRGVGDNWLAQSGERASAEDMADLMTTWLWAGAGAELHTADSKE